jgi:hypothetical protein
LNNLTHEHFAIDYVINDKIFRAKKTNGNQEIGHETIAFVPGSYDKSGNANFVIKQYRVWKKL